MTFTTKRNGAPVLSPPGLPRSRGDRVSAWLRGPLTAVQFLTILPLTARRVTQPRELGPAEAFFPCAGLLIGVLLLGVDRLLSGVASRPVVDVLLVATAAAVTGALHLDGIVDTFDAVFAPGGPTRRLEIMHDPRAGSFGVVAVVLLLGLKVAALGSLSPELRPAALLLGPCFGRWSIVTVTSAFRYARPIGSGRAFKDAVRPIHTAVAGLIVFVAAALSAGWVGVVVAGLMTLVALVLGRWYSGRLGGLTGDTYGATCELVETTTWLIFGLHLAGMSPVAPWLAELLPPTRWSAMLALAAPGHGGFFG